MTYTSAAYEHYAGYRELVNRRSALRSRLRSLRSCAPASPRMDGMPHGSTVGRPTESRVVQIKTIESELRLLEGEINARERELDAMISAAPDDLTQELLRLRLREGFPWATIAQVLGGGLTPERCRLIVSRYFARIENRTFRQQLESVRRSADWRRSCDDVG